jgi:hypothetical protein
MRPPFDIIDFSEFLPLFGDPSDVLANLRSLAAYFAVHGRANILTYLYLSANWAAFGMAAAGWHITIAVLCATATGAAYADLRRLGASAHAALAGATLFVVSSGAAGAWTRVTGEPLATLLLLTALWLATWYQSTARPVVIGIATAVAAAAMILTKEVLVATVPAIWLVAACAPATPIRARHHRTRRNRHLAVALLAASMITLLPTALARPAPSGYAASYTLANIDATRAVRNLLALWLPMRAETSVLGASLMLPANFAFAAVLLLAAGLAVPGLFRGRARWSPGFLRRPAIVLAAAGLLTVGALAVYIPWPRFESFYAFPFLLAPASVLALALDSFRTRGTVARVVAGALTTVTVVYAAGHTIHTSGAVRARRLVEAHVADMLAGRTPDTVYVARAAAPVQEWQGTAATLRRFAALRHPGSRLPVALQVGCDAAGSMAASPGPRTFIVNYLRDCEPLPRSTMLVRARFRYPDWVTFQLRVDSFAVDIMRDAPRRPAPHIR